MTRIWNPIHTRALPALPCHAMPSFAARPAGPCLPCHACRTMPAASSLAAIARRPPKQWRCGFSRHHARTACLSLPTSVSHGEHGRKAYGERRLGKGVPPTGALFEMLARTRGRQRPEHSVRRRPRDFVNCVPHEARAISIFQCSATRSISRGSPCESPLTSLLSDIDTLPFQKGYAGQAIHRPVFVMDQI